MKNLEKEVKINIDGGSIKGDLGLPKEAVGIVVFAHGSGSSRLSPRNHFVAEELNKVNIATLLFDLLTEEEDEVYENRFNIDLLTERLIEATKWIEDQKNLKNLPIGYFGASTGSAAALKAAVSLGKKIKAVVSRGGRPDMAMSVLEQVVSPTLLIVGGEDIEVLELNETAFRKLINCIKRLDIVEEATHLFEEPGALEEVAKLAREWFKKYFKKGG